MEKSKKPTPNTIKTVSNALLTPDFDLEVPIEERSEDNELVGPVRAYAWPILLQQTGWCKSLKGKLTTTSEGKEFMGHISTESFRQGIQRLLLNDEFDELNRIPNIKGQSGKGLWGCSRPSERKKWICQSISKWPIQKWIPFEEAFRFVYSSGLGYLVVRDAYHLYFSESRYGNLCGYEMEISKQYFRVFLFETLATLGIVDVGYCYPHWLWPEMSYCWGNEPLDFCGRYDGLQFVRLSQLGAFSLGLTDHFEIPKGEATERFKVLANHEIVLTGRHDGNSSNLHFLEMIADRNGEYSWRLEKKNILTFLETGGTIHEILDFLKQGISENIPRTVEVFLSDIGNKIGVFGKSEEAILVEINDPLTATLIANHSLTKKYCYQAGEHRLAILKKSQRAFRSALKKLGYILP